MSADGWTETLHLPVKVTLSKGPRGWMAEDRDGNVVLGKDRGEVLAKLALNRAISEEYPRKTGLTPEDLDALVEDLFRTGSPHPSLVEKADRLVMWVDGNPGRDLGGWCREAVKDRIRRALEGKGDAR